jgi:hypothetical protein
MHFVREGTQVTTREQATRDAIETVFLDRSQDALIDLRTGGDVGQRELASGSCLPQFGTDIHRMDGDASAEPDRRRDWVFS